MKKLSYFLVFSFIFLISNSVFANTYPHTLEDIRKLTFAHDQLTGTDYENDYSDPVLVDGSDALNLISSGCPNGCFTDSDVEDEIQNVLSESDALAIHFDLPSTPGLADFLYVPWPTESDYYSVNTPGVLIFLDIFPGPEDFTDWGLIGASGNSACVCAASNQNGCKGCPSNASALFGTESNDSLYLTDFDPDDSLPLWD